MYVTVTCPSFLKIHFAFDMQKSLYLLINMRECSDYNNNISYQL